MRSRAVLERELLELAHEPLAALADLGDERAGALVVELDAELAAPGRRATSAARGPSSAISAAIWPPAASTALCSAAGAL